MIVAFPKTLVKNRRALVYCRIRAFVCDSLELPVSEPNYVTPLLGWIPHLAEKIFPEHNMTHGTV
jgi:hypothetical protein